MLCYTVPHCRPARDISAKSSIVFNTPSDADCSTSLLIGSSLDRYLASKRILSPLEISTQTQVWWQTQEGRVFYPMIWCLGKCAHCKGAISSSKSIQVIEWYIFVCTRIPSFFYQDQNLLIFPVERSSSNSSSNIPRYDANELIISFSPPKMISPTHIWTINPWGPPQLSSLLLTPPFFFTESTGPRLK